MTDLFHNYNIKSNSSGVKLNYSRTSKDWLDFLILLLFGLVPLLVSCFLIIQTLKTGFSWIYTIIIILFGFVSVIKIIELISRLSEPTKGIITIDKKTNSIIIKKPHFKKEKILMSELDHIEYRLHTDFIRLSDSRPKRRYWIEIEIHIKSDRKIKILNINPSQIIDSGNEETKRELFKIAKPLIKKISNELGINYIYKGVVDVEKD